MPLTDKAAVGQRPSKLCSGPILSTLERLNDQFDAAIPSRWIEIRLAVDRLVQLLNAGRSDLQYPTHVLSGHEVPRRAQDVRSEEISPIELSLQIGDGEPGASHAKRPQCVAVLLRLNAAQ
jgi:hypothetical protein